MAAQTEDWRRKYMDSLRAMEREAQLFREQQQALRKLVGRLCLAAQGQSTRLDGALEALKQAMRRDGEIDVEALGQDVADAVKELDHGTATLTQLRPADLAPGAARPGDPLNGEARVRSLFTRLLAELRREPRLVEAAAEIHHELAQPLTHAQLPKIVERLGGLVVQRIHTLEKGQQEMELLLGQMVAQLDSFSRFVAGEMQDRAERSSSDDALNVQITGEMRALGETVETGTDVVTIRRQLRQRLDAIGRHLQGFRERESERTRLARERSDQMRGRMEELEGEAKRLQASLQDEKRLSLLDPLTRIPNRLAYEQRVEEELDRWRRFNEPTCIATWDIDHFKNVNDSYGHRAGDKVLGVVAAAFADGIRSTDFVGRYGGEEFVMILTGTPLADAVRLVERMREQIAAIGFHFRGAPVTVTISCGITALREGDSADDAFDRADKAMYQAKGSGRNRTVSA